jgi:quinol monooxygenase YgiN
VSYVKANEPGTLRYESWQEKGDPTRFLHVFVFRDADAERIHSNSAAVDRLIRVLYPECVEPVVCTDFDLITAR